MCVCAYVCVLCVCVCAYVCVLCVCVCACSARSLELLGGVSELEELFDAVLAQVPNLVYSAGQRRRPGTPHKDRRIRARRQSEAHEELERCTVLGSG